MESLLETVVRIDCKLFPVLTSTRIACRGRDCIEMQNNNNNNNPIVVPWLGIYIPLGSNCDHFCKIFFIRDVEKQNTEISKLYMC